MVWLPSDGGMRYVEFCSSFSPLLLLHLLIPTWYHDESHPLSSVLSLVALPLSRKTLTDHFVYSREAVKKKGRYWTMLSYMFLHHDAAHLLSNAWALILAGPTTVEALGKWGALATYLGAGVVAAMDPPRFYDLQFERFICLQWWSLRASLRSVYESLSSSSTDFFETYLDAYIPQSVVTTFSDAIEYSSTFIFGETSAKKAEAEKSAVKSFLKRRDTQSEQFFEWVTSGFDALDGAAQRFATSIAAGAAKSRRLIGASAGVSAFLAVDACASAEVVIFALTNSLRRYYRHKNDNKRRPLLPDDDDDDDEEDSNLGSKVVYAAVHALGTLHYFLGEATRTYGGDLSLVDHGAHLNGMAVGVAAFLFARGLRSWRRHHLSNKFSGSDWESDDD